jgi:hypothetical protein
VPAWLLPLLSLLFFFSGACALVYQVMWLRLLALVFGVMVYASATPMLLEGIKQRSVQPFELSRTAYEQRYQDPRFRELFDWNFDTIVRTYLAGPDQIKAWLDDGPILTDDKPAIEYFLSLPRNEPAPDLTPLRPRPEDIVRP